MKEALAVLISIAQRRRPFTGLVPDQHALSPPDKRMALPRRDAIEPTKYTQRDLKRMLFSTRKVQASDGFVLKRYLLDASPGCQAWHVISPSHGLCRLVALSSVNGTAKSTLVLFGDFLDTSFLSALFFRTNLLYREEEDAREGDAATFDGL